VLLAAVGTVIGSMLALLRTPAGFPIDGLTTMRITLPLQRYDADARTQFFTTLLERVRALPGVDSATVALQHAPFVFSTARFEIDGQPAGERLPTAFTTVTDARYPETFGIPMRAGRWLDERAAGGSPREVVINDVAAQRYFGEASPIGRRIRIAPPAGDHAWATITGVLAGVRNRGLAAPPAAEIFLPLAQAPERRRSQLHLVVRAAADVPVVRPVQQIVRGLDADLPVYSIATVAQLYDEGLRLRRVSVLLLGAFAALTVALAALGIYGVLSHTVAARTREIGIRLALGARGGQVRWLIARQALLPSLAGIVLGVGLALLTRQVAASLLFGLRTSTLAVAVGAAIVLLVAACAGYVPSRRAARVDPTVTLATPIS
jgi:putative ABC transport system permease protein